LANSKNSETFNKAFTALMDDYYHLKDNFITEKDSVINFYAQKIVKDADALPLAELKGDATINDVAKSLVTGIKSEVEGLRGEKDMKGKRKSLNMLTSQLYDLVRTVKYDREIVYHQHCPMAFTDGDENGYWLSRSADVKNPYLPKTMLTCGDVADSLNYTK
jgi:Cu(I)/Ag(I) efflux system membrane fusion protein